MLLKHCKLVLFFETGKHYQGPRGLKIPIAEGIKMFTLLIIEEHGLSCWNSTYSQRERDTELQTQSNDF